MKFLKGTLYSPSSEFDTSVKYLISLILKKYFEFEYLWIIWNLDISSSDAVIFEKREPISTHNICMSLNFKK